MRADSEKCGRLPDSDFLEPAVEVVFYSLENEHAERLVPDAIFQAEHSLGGPPRRHHHQRAVGRSA